VTTPILADPVRSQLQGTVLIVDDDIGLQETLCEILEVTGIAAVGVGSANEATTWCDRNSPDLALLDQRLPDASGLQLAALLKARLPTLPVVLLTGYVSTDTAIAAVGLVDDYLTKPVPPSELIKVVQTRLEQHRLRTANQNLLSQLREANSRLELTVQERTRELRAARDQALEGSRLKSQFLANMSHEIRTPMNGVLGAADLLAVTDLTDEQRSYVDILTSSGQALLGVINDILDFSKIEAGHLELELSLLSLADILNDVSTMFRPLATEKGLDLTLRVAPDLPEAVLGDAIRLRQIVTNLVGNAVKFTSTGSVEASLDVVRQARGAVDVRFEVTDTGIGIAAEDIPRLFSDFTQADPSTTRRFGGTGLGLAISDRLVRLMGGQIGCTSRLAGGSTFWFTISLGVPQKSVEANLETSAADSTTSARSPDSPDGPLILVVEDNDVNAVILTRMLALLGYRSDAVRSGPDALAAATRTEYAAILMDCQMPIMDGFTTTTKLREQERSDQHAPVVAITATATTEDEGRCMAAGMDDYLPKPIVMERLAEVLHHWAPLRPT
jgi:signal transduction histidine kinase